MRTSYSRWNQRQVFLPNRFYVSWTANCSSPTTLGCTNKYMAAKRNRNTGINKHAHTDRCVRSKRRQYCSPNCGKHCETRGARNKKAEGGRSRESHEVCGSKNEKLGETIHSHVCAKGRSRSSQVDWNTRISCNVLT